MARHYAVLLAVLLGAGLVVSGAVLADLGSDPATAAPSPDDASPSSTIQVSATGSAAAQPDAVVVRLAIEATDENATLARAAVAENVSAVRAALLDLGLSEGEIRTAGYDLYRDERRVAEKRGVEEPVYRVSHELVVETDDVESAGTVVDAAIASGATGVYDVRFTLSESTRESLKSAALADAMDGARAKAEALAGSANLTLATVDRITTTGGVRTYHDAALAATPAPGGADTDIDAGPVGVTASIRVTYNATA